MSYGRSTMFASSLLSTYSYIRGSLFIYSGQNKFLTKLIYEYCTSPHISLNIYRIKMSEMTSLFKSQRE
jgi:hypothetical protein